MIEYKAYPNEDLNLDGFHTWTEGLSYQAFIGNGRIKLASNEGEVSYDESKIGEIGDLFIFDEI